MRHTLADQSGAVLVITLLVITILVLTLSDFLFATWVDWSMAAGFRDDVKALSGASSGVDAAKEIIIDDFRNDRANKSNVDTLHEPWATSIPLPMGGGMVFVAIKDESGKIDLNRLVNNAGRDKVRLDVFLRLLDYLDLDEDIGEAVVDWIDADDAGPYEFGYYQSLEHPYPCKNGKFDSLEELKRVANVTPAAYEKLKPFVSISSIGQININTAPQEVLIALHDQITAGMAADLIYERGTTAFTNPAEIRKIPGWSDLYSKIAGLITVRTDTFSVVSTVTVGEVTRIASAIFTKRTGNDATMIYFRVM
jgi:general secretion pathway protein K